MKHNLTIRVNAIVLTAKEIALFCCYHKQQVSHQLHTFGATAAQRARMTRLSQVMQGPQKQYAPTQGCVEYVNTSLSTTHTNNHNVLWSVKNLPAFHFILALERICAFRVITRKRRFVRIEMKFYRTNTIPRCRSQLKL